MAYHRTIFAAVQEFIRLHPKTPKNYFAKQHRGTTGFFGKKIYLSELSSRWQVMELNAFHFLWRRLVLLFTFGQIKLYGNLHLKKVRFRSNPVSYEQEMTNTIRKFYEDLMGKIHYKAWSTNPYERKRAYSKQLKPLTKQEQSLLLQKLTTSIPKPNSPFQSQQEHLLELLKLAPRVSNDKLQNTMEQHFLAVAKKHQRALFKRLDMMTPHQQASLVYLLRSDPKISLGIWTGLMYHGKAFAQSTREKTRQWVVTLMVALSQEQFNASLNDAKFWEVFELFPDEIAATLTLNQWEMLINATSNCELIGKILLALPVDDVLYDKLLVACGKIPINFGKELQMQMKISELSRYLKKKNDPRSVDVLNRARKSSSIIAHDTKPAAKHKFAHHQKSTLNFQTTPHEIVNKPRSNSLCSLDSEQPLVQKWTESDLRIVLNNIENFIEKHEQRIELVHEILCHYLTLDEHSRTLCQQAIKTLARYYPDCVYNISSLSTLAIQRLILILDHSDAELICGIWDSLMSEASEFGLTKEQLTFAKAATIFSAVTPNQYAACVKDNKLWAVLNHFSSVAAVHISALSLSKLAPQAPDPKKFAKLIANLPLDDQLADKLLAVCPYIELDHQLLLQLTSKVQWLKRNQFTEQAQKLESMIQTPEAKPMV